MAHLTHRSVNISFLKLLSEAANGSTLIQINLNHIQKLDSSNFGFKRNGD